MKTGGQKTISDKIKVKLPTVLSIKSGSFNPRISSFRDKMMSQKKAIEILELKDLEDNNKNNFGYQGSPTRVKNMFVPKITRNGQVLSASRSENVDFLLEKLTEWEELI